MYRDNNVGGSDLSFEDVNETYREYFDIYSDDSGSSDYSKRILGDATGEMGPFYQNGQFQDYWPKYINNWYSDYSLFVDSSRAWFVRGGGYSDGVGAGQFNFKSSLANGATSRLVFAY